MISVYIITHNRRKMLERALTSVMNQSMQPDEIIIVDDASTDDTKAYIDRILPLYNSLVYLRNENASGAQVSRNRALAIAKGKYITGLDDDDEFKHDRIEKLYNAFKSEESLSFVCDHIEIDTGTEQLYPNKFVGRIDLNHALDFNIMGPQIFTLKDNLVAIGGFDTKFPAWQDYDTWVRLIKRFGDCRKIKGASYIQHTSHDKGRISNSNKHQEAFELFVNKHKSSITNANLLSLTALTNMLSNQNNSFLVILGLLLSFRFKRFFSAIKTNLLKGKKI